MKRIIHKSRRVESYVFSRTKMESNRCGEKRGIEKVMSKLVVRMED
jgi:hypothetical protein